jgi:predicted enzyme related to lactoylglutathione lyase
VSLGRFCWHDLVTPDVERTAAFYGALLGWRLHEVDLGSATPYWTIHNGNREAGGVLQRPASEVAPHWMPVVQISDCERAAGRVGTLAGSTELAPIAVPGAGCFAVVRDAERVPLGLKASTDEDEAPPSEVRHGCVVRFDLFTGDRRQARAFYPAVVGWSATEDAFLQGGRAIARLRSAASGPAGWGAAVAVDDVGRACEQAVALGATSHERGEGAAVLTDPVGVRIIVVGASPDPR